MRYLLLAIPLAMLAGCVVRTGPYTPYRTYGSPPPAAHAEVYYYGNHYIPENVGGGWCYIDGPHTHDYYPDRNDWYDYDQGYYWYRGPFMFSFFGGHPLPGGGWCFLNGPHQHDYFPPSGSDWRWNRNGFVYQGGFRPNRPPPASYWPRATPRQDWRNNRPAVHPAPASPRFGAPGRPDERAAPPPPGFGRRPEPTPAPEERPGASGWAPGHGGTPPGHGGEPPGHARPEEDRRGPPVFGGVPAGRDDRRGPPDAGPPGRSEEDRRGPPSFTPPGREDRGGGPPAFTPPGREDRGGGRRDEPPGRVDRPGAGPAAPAPAARPAEEKKEKKDDKKDEKDDRPVRGFRR